MGQEIPKVIHATYPSKESMSPALRENLNFIRGNNPDFDLRLYDDGDIENYIQAHYDEPILRAYRSINPAYGAARADLFRYLCVFHEGGVYLDVKSRPTKPLSTVLRPSDRYILAQWDGVAAGGRYASWGRHAELRHFAGGEFQQWHVIGCAGHPFLREVLNRVLRNITRYFPFVHGCGRPAVLRTTGPVAYTLAIAPVLGWFPHRMVNAGTDLGLQYSFLEGQPGATHLQFFPRHYAYAVEPLICHHDAIDSAFGWVQRRKQALWSWLRDRRLIGQPGRA